MKAYHNTAIVFGNIKDALLYFEYVIPMNFAGDSLGLRPGSKSGRGIEQHKERIISHRELQEVFGESDFAWGVPCSALYPPPLSHDRSFLVRVNLFDGMLAAHMMINVHGGLAFKTYYQGHLVQQSRIKPGTFPTRNHLRKIFSNLVTDFQLQNTPIDCSPFFGGLAKDEPPTDSLFVPHVSVIDSSKLTLSQIMEFRKDKETMNKMRKFRLFAYEQYKGKEKAYIEDDIQKKLADYNAAVKSCGFETTYKTLSFLFESKMIIGTFATCAVSLLMGNAQLAREAFATGAVIELGKLSLEYAKQRHALKRICLENPISYIAEAKQISR